MNKWPQLVELSWRLPIFTTIISAGFACIILARYRLRRRSYHLLWWGIGISIYGEGHLSYDVNLAL